MKTLIIISTLLLATITLAQKNRTHYKTELDLGNGTVFSTQLNVTSMESGFIITSPKNADSRIFGTLKAKLGRLLGKSPKKGIIITIKGNIVKDSLFGETKIPMLGKLKFKGIAKNETLTGELFSNDTSSIGTLNGKKSDENKIDYSYLYPKVLKTIQDNIYSKSALQNKEWDKFQKKIKKLSDTAHDDIELFLGFNMLVQKLPFTHLNLFITKEEIDSEEAENKNKAVVFEEKNNSTAYLLIKNFSTSKDELETILPKIVENPNYKNLIIDLRNNGGGGIEPAFALAKYITKTDMEVGYFVTNKLQYSGFQLDVFNKLPSLQPKGTVEFGEELKNSSGVKLIFKKPENPVFNGKLYVLTNEKTGSTCEPIVYVLKNNKNATIIGKKTAGAMLAAFPFVVSGKYTVMLPIADFYTYDGIRLDKVGVTPDIEVKSEDALDKALELINKNN